MFYHRLNIFYKSMLIVMFIVFGFVGSLWSAEERSQEELAEVAGELLDPLSDLWILSVDNYSSRLSAKSSDDDDKYMNQLVFQAYMPYEIIDDKLIWLNSPSFTTLTIPYEGEGYDTQVTNLAWSSILGYKAESGWVFGAGPSIEFPAYNKFSSEDWSLGAPSKGECSRPPRRDPH